jgi:hypothetical protein
MSGESDRPGRWAARLAPQFWSKMCLAGRRLWGWKGGRQFAHAINRWKRFSPNSRPQPPR